MSTVSIAIVGCGAATKRYYVPALRNKKEIIENIFLVDTNKDQAQELSIELNGGMVVTDYKEVIDRIQGAIIILPNNLHYKVSKDFLQAGVNVLCEKPLAETFEEVDDLIKIAKDKNVVLCVNNTRRMFPNFSTIRDDIKKMQIGKLKSISYTEGNTFAWPSETGFYVNPSVTNKGLLSDLGPHVLDTICWWLDDCPSLTQYYDDSFGGPESVSQIKAVCNNCKIDIFLNRLCDIDCQYEIIGEKGTIKGNVFEWDKYLISSGTDSFIEKKLSCSAKTYPEFVVPIVDNFIDVVKNKVSPIVSGKDIQNSIRFIEDCYNNRSRFNLPWYDEVDKKSKKEKGKILVTGATGFIGGNIVEKLFFSNGCDYRAAVHQWANAARIGRFPIEIVQLDLMNIDSIKSSLEGVTKVIHCAKGPEGVTEIGTKNLLEASIEMGIQHFLHLSTTEIYGNVAEMLKKKHNFNIQEMNIIKRKLMQKNYVGNIMKKDCPLPYFVPL